jgi:RimJ/RimL family protein N-acetyltransferase
MQAAGEPNGLAAPRLVHGDEFFGWLVGGKVVSFGWVTYRDRAVGPVGLAEAPGRAFLFNFHTLEGYRGRGLYSGLLLAMRCVLGHEKVTEFVIDVNVQNTASARGIAKAGFLPVGHITYITIFNRWCYALKRTVIDTAGPSPF